METELDISFQRGIDLFLENQDTIYTNLINSYHTWHDDNLFKNNVILAHIVINELDCKCEIISLLHRYHLICSGYDILFKPAGEEWQIRNCKCKYPKIFMGLYCDNCQRKFKVSTEKDNNDNSNFFLSLDFTNLDELQEEPNTMDFCGPCIQKNPELLEKYKLIPIKKESLHYFGFNLYSVLNFKSYLIWDWNQKTKSEIKKPATILLKDYEYYRSLQDRYVEYRINKKENELTRKYEDYTSQFGMHKLY